MIVEDEVISRKLLDTHLAQHGKDGLDGAKIIMTTALSDNKNIMDSFRQGCESCIVKPIEKEVLIKEIQKFGLIDLKTGV